MGFAAPHKRLEKVHGDLLNDTGRVSAYVNEMIRVQNGARYVYSWNTDLKQLKITCSHGAQPNKGYRDLTNNKMEAA